MDEELEQLKKRLLELSEKAWSSGRYFYTDFLSEAEQSVFHMLEAKYSPAGYALYGGYEGADRCMARFGSLEALGYEEAYPIACIRIYPAAPKYAEALTHRDFLGALMHLGIERDMLGDLLVQDAECFLFCRDRMADFLLENVAQVRHTQMRCERAEGLPEALRPKRQEISIQVASERMDAIAAELCRLSRSAAAALFPAQKVYVNGLVCENPSMHPKEGDTISLRGFGKYRYLGESGRSRKGRLYLNLEKYV
ncbi:MAG: hypothetical protein K6E81_03060 [Lachnospiraceae bacterium]|nr:hypothetical protein [Lachnospiraceae bacterium]